MNQRKLGTHRVSLRPAHGHRGRSRAGLTVASHLTILLAWGRLAIAILLAMICTACEPDSKEGLTDRDAGTAAPGAAGRDADATGRDADAAGRDLDAAGGSGLEPTSPPASVVVLPRAGLITNPAQPLRLEAHVFDASGREVDASGLAIAWKSTDPAAITVARDPKNPAVALATSVVAAGQATVMATLEGVVDATSRGASLTSVSVADHTVVIPESDVVFPPPEAVGMASAVLPRDITPTTGGQTKIGSFSEQEVLEKLRVVEGSPRGASRGAPEVSLHR